ncbi:hypothetical protein Srut_53560 [Streptomyces rutgersensis]|nr:hypothetical protein Srut_53560 [Streptomyces rutgersensis]
MDGGGDRAGGCLGGEGAEAAAEVEEDRAVDEPAGRGGAGFRVRPGEGDADMGEEGEGPARSRRGRVRGRPPPGTSRGRHGTRQASARHGAVVRIAAIGGRLRPGS